MKLFIGVITICSSLWYNENLCLCLSGRQFWDKKAPNVIIKFFPETNKMAFLFPSGNLARSDLIIVINYGPVVTKYRLSTEQHMIEYIRRPLCSDLRSLSYSNLIFWGTLLDCNCLDTLDFICLPPFLLSFLLHPHALQLDAFTGSNL